MIDIPPEAPEVPEIPAFEPAVVKEHKDDYWADLNNWSLSDRKQKQKEAKKKGILIPDEDLAPPPPAPTPPAQGLTPEPHIL